MKYGYHGYRADRNDPRDHLFETEEAYLRPYVERLGLGTSHIENQGQLGSCTGNSSTSAVEIVMPSLGQLSRRMAYYNGRAIEGTINQDSGCEIRDVIKGLVNVGVSRESLCPYSITAFTRKPSAAAFTDAAKNRDAIKAAGVLYERVLDLSGVLAAVNANQPVVIGFTVYDSFESEQVARNGIMPMPKAGERALGGHAVTVVGYDLQHKFVWVQNSWGTGWGIGGYFQMPFAYFTAGRVSDMWTLRKTK